MKTLKDFKYYFNNEGELRHINTEKRFEFEVYDNDAANQKRYEQLGEVVEEHVYALLESDCNLVRATIPINASATESKGFIFHSDDIATCEKLLLLINGSGAVKAGQWARKLIINHSLYRGTQIPYIKKARELGYAVLVLNTNMRRDKSTGDIIDVSKTPEKHFHYVWEEFVMRNKSAHVAIVAHSYGGVITTRAAAQVPSVIERTFGAALTDSVHGLLLSSKKRYSKWMRLKVCNWASSSKDLDELIQQGGDGHCLTVSAGTNIHEETSWKALESVFRFLHEKWNLLQEDRIKRSKDNEKSLSITHNAINIVLRTQESRSKEMCEGTVSELKANTGSDNDSSHSMLIPHRSPVTDTGEMKENFGGNVTSQQNLLNKNSKEHITLKSGGEIKMDIDNPVVKKAKI